MKKVTLNDKDVVVDNLCSSFDDNKSVNYIITQDVKRELRIRKPIAYFFDSVTRLAILPELLIKDKNKMLRPKSCRGLDQKQVKLFICNF